MEIYTMPSKNFFMRLLLSLAYVTLALLFLLTLLIAISRIMMQRVEQNQEAPCICYVAGRSGGHLIPAMTLAARDRTRYPKAPIIIFTAATPLDLFVMKKYPWVTHHEPLALENHPRGLTYTWFTYLIAFTRATIKAFNLLRQHHPTCVTTTGGYIAIPVCFAARALGIPTYLYNLDVEPGAAIAFLSRFATKVIVCFEETKNLLPASAKSESGSYPLRFDEHDIINKKDARRMIGLDTLSDKSKVLLVIGGSQGSRFINDLVPHAVAPWASTESLFVLHQTGEGEVQRVKDLYAEKKIPAFVFPYHDNMSGLYQAADLVISRAGAGSLFEIAFFKIPAIIIPLETATTAHQIANATAIAARHPHIFTVQLQDWNGDFGTLIRNRL